MKKQKSKIIFRIFQNSLLVLIALGAGGFACSPGKAAGVLRPDDPKAADVLKAPPCDELGDELVPYVVDWQSSDRGKLEILMRKGVPVVSYTCQGLKLLRNCYAEGDFDFNAMQLKKDVIQFNNTDEIKTAFPFSGIKMAGKLKAELSRGTNLNLARALRGEESTSLWEVNRSMLRGRCDGATHFVQGAYVGAFALKTGSTAKVSGAAELFSAEGGYKSTSKKFKSIQDGDLKKCEAGRISDKNPPAGCGAVIQLNLIAIKEGGKLKRVSGKQYFELSKKEKIQEKEEEARRAATAGKCPANLLYSQGKCIYPTAENKKSSVYTCSPGDFQECRDQCQKGDGQSCYRLGYLHLNDKKHKDIIKGMDRLSRGCELENAPSCNYLASVFSLGLFGQSEDQKKGQEYYEKGCDYGSYESCQTAGARLSTWTEGVKQNAKKGFSLMEKACKGGIPRACHSLAIGYGNGDVVARDEAKSYYYSKKSCDGGVAKQCVAAAVGYKMGLYFPRDFKKMFYYFKRGCQLGDRSACRKLKEF